MSSHEKSYVLIGHKPTPGIDWKDIMDSAIWTANNPYVDVWLLEELCKAHIDNINLDRAIPVRMDWGTIIKRFCPEKKGLLVHPNEIYIPFGNN